MSKLASTKTADQSLVDNPVDGPQAEELTGKSAVLAVQPDQALSDKQANSLEVGGPEGPEPTRFGDWERKGRCIDF